SRWSARGLTNLLVECGFDRGEIRAEQWGNRQCVEADLEPSWGIYDPELHSLKNEPRFPVMSWALARKETG
ncbi:MAG: dihydrolipoamide dehydrogenase, partial [Pseudomonadota bacterium]